MACVEFSSKDQVANLNKLGHKVLDFSLVLERAWTDKAAQFDQNLSKSEPRELILRGLEFLKCLREEDVEEAVLVHFANGEEPIALGDCW